MNILEHLMNLKTGKISTLKLENGRGMSVDITWDNAWFVQFNGRVSKFTHINALAQCLRRDGIIYYART